MAKRGTRDFFAWTDDEVELLLKVTLEYKVVNAAQNTDWESAQNKYGDILDRFRERYPTPADAMTVDKEYPHTKEEVSKVQLTTKVKAIRGRYRQAVASGKRRGHGRVVLLYFELCQSIWGGAIREGIKTEDMAVEDLGANGNTSSVSGGDRGTEDATSAETETVASRRRRPDASLGGHRRERLKRRNSMDSVAQEDLEIKRRLLQRLQATDAEFVETMGRWSSTMDRLNTNIEVLMQHIVGSGNRPVSPTPQPIYVWKHAGAD